MSEFAVVYIYIDDIAIFSKDLDSLLEYLAKDLGATRKESLTIKLSKYHFGMLEMVYLGHPASTRNIMMEQDGGNPEVKTLKDQEVGQGFTGFGRLLQICLVLVW